MTLEVVDSHNPCHLFLSNYNDQTMKKNKKSIFDLIKKKDQKAILNKNVLKQLKGGVIGSDDVRIG